MGGGAVGSAEHLEAGQLRGRDAGVDCREDDVGTTRPAPARLVEHGRRRARAIGVSEIDPDVRATKAGALLCSEQLLRIAVRRLDVGRRRDAFRRDDVQVDVRERVDHLVGKRLGQARP